MCFLKCWGHDAGTKLQLYSGLLKPSAIGFLHSSCYAFRERKHVLTIRVGDGPITNQCHLLTFLVKNLPCHWLYAIQKKCHKQENKCQQETMRYHKTKDQEINQQADQVTEWINLPLILLRSLLLQLYLTSLLLQLYLTHS